MNNNTNNSKFITLFIIALFIIFSYAIIKGFFNENRNPIHTKDKDFNFIYDIELLNKDNLDKLYDETRTNRVVIKKNYERTTGNPGNNKIKLNTSNIDYIFSNGAETPTYYKLTLKDIDYLNIYSINESNSSIKMLILGTDLKYYNISLSILALNDKIDKNNKEWNAYEKNDVSIFPNELYKVVDDYCLINLNLPYAMNEAKIKESVFFDLKDKLTRSISIEKVNESSTNYYSFDAKDINLSKNIKLKIKDNKVNNYFYRHDDNSNISLTLISFIKGDRVISLSEIEDKEIFNSYIDNYGFKRKEYNYRGNNITLLYLDNKVSNEGIIYDSIIFDIDNKYYSVNSLNKEDVVNDNNIDTWIDSLISDFLLIN